MSEHEVHVIIRTAGERTFEAARHLAAMQVPPGAIDVVAERPFEAALRKTFEVGLARGARWTMTLDADVLLRAGALSRLLRAAEDQPEEVIQVEGAVFDKLTGDVRSAGHRLYRTKHLRDALRLIPETGTEIRPEYSTLLRLEQDGFHSSTVDCIAGIHDFEQYYGDIYRKTFVHANKHAGILSEMVVRSKRLAAEDQDFLVALKGLYDGLLTVETVRIDADAHAGRLPAILTELGLVEKPGLPADLATAEYVERVLLEDSISEATIRGKLSGGYRQSGILRMVPRVAGAGLYRIGNTVAGWGQRLHARAVRDGRVAAEKPNAS